MSEPTRDEIAARLAEIAAMNDGVLTPEAVVKDARSPKSVLHSLFEWDDKKAAADQRIDQARRIIRSVRIDVRIEKTVVSCVGYVRDPALSKEPGYRAVTEIRTDADAARAALDNEIGRISALVDRAVALARVLGLEDEAKEIAERVEAFRRRLVPTESHVN